MEGDLDRAGRHLARAGDHHVDLTRRARLALARCEPDEASRLADAALAVPERLDAPPGRPFELVLARTARAEAINLRDGAAAATPHVADTLAWAASTKIPPVVARAALPSARILATRGDALGEDVARSLATHPHVESEVRRGARDVAASGAADADPRVDGPLRAAAERALDVLTRA